MAKSHDGSRIEAAEAGAHAAHGADAHGSDQPGAEHDAHSAHGADPNADVLVAEPPTPAWVLTSVGIALLTIAISAVLAVMLHNADDAVDEPAHGPAPAEAPAGEHAEEPAKAPAEAPAHGLSATSIVIARA